MCLKESVLGQKTAESMISKNMRTRMIDVITENEMDNDSMTAQLQYFS